MAIQRLPPKHMRRLSKIAAIVAVVLAATWLAGCGEDSGATGTFERNFTVNGPVHLEVASGNGDVHVSAAGKGEVRIHGEIHAHGWGSQSEQKMLDEVISNPPVSQEGNLIRVSASGHNLHEVSIDYTIEVPAETEIHCSTGSGDVKVEGIQGPATFSSGSGDVTALSIAGDIQTKTGSGDIKLEQVQGQVQIVTGSGDIEIHGAKGAIRLATGSGDIEITRPGDNVVADTSSGSIEVNDATADLRLHAKVSGEITVDGDPGATNYWDLHSSSGDVTLHVPRPRVSACTRTPAPAI